MTGLCIDLCSGLGGFSQAFWDADWDVIRIDNNPKFRTVPNTIIGSILDSDFIHSTIIGKPDVIVASPPCERFSLANRRFPEKGIQTALNIVGAVFEIIAEYRPKHWIVENPRGRLRWFIGKPNSTVNLACYGTTYRKTTDLWHNLTFSILNTEVQGIPSLTSTQNNGNGSTGLLRLRDPAKRAQIPLGLSKAVLEAVSF